MVFHIDYWVLFAASNVFAVLALFAVVIACKGEWQNWLIIRKTLPKYDRNQENCIHGFEDIPGPRGPLGLLVIVAKLLPFIKSVEKGIGLVQEFPAFFKAQLLGLRVVVLHEASLVQQVLKSADAGHFSKPAPAFDLLRPFIGNGLLVSTGDMWHKQRKIIMRSQGSPSVKASMTMLNKYCKSLVKSLETLFQDGKTHEISDPISVVFLQITLEMITGADFENSEELENYHKNVHTWKTAVAYQFGYIWFWLKPIWKLYPMSRAYDKALRELNEFGKKMINDHKRKWESKSPMEEDANDYRCLLDELRDADVNEQQLLDEVNVTIFGGHDTSATLLHFFCLCLSLNPEIQESCRQEVDELFEDDNNMFGNRFITYEAVQSNLKLVERCILETLRLFPPAIALLRQLESPLTLEYESKKYIVPAGTSVGLFPLLTQRNAVYYPEPNKFDPNRFLPEEMAKRPAYSFYPFSGGKRSCVGQKIAMVQTKLVAAYILRNFIMTTTDTMDSVPLIPLFVVSPERSYIFEFKKRPIIQ